jgi:hypothetical protein
MMVEPLSTDHLLSPALTTVKQLAPAFFQVVQKPSLDSFHVPSPLAPPPPPAARRKTWSECHSAQALRAVPQVST